jgi:pyruvate-formate lyase-activating enzyme
MASAPALAVDGFLAGLAPGETREIDGIKARREQWGATFFDKRYDRVWAMDEPTLARHDSAAALAAAMRDRGDPFLTRQPYFLGKVPASRDCTLEAPISVSWVLNRACQSSCIYCCTNSHALAHPGIDVAAGIALATTLGRWGALRLIIGGGEPLLHPDLEAIVETAAAHGLPPVLATNGFLLDESRARALATKVAQFQISLDSVDERLYAALRGRAGGPAEALAAVRAALGVGAGVRVVTVVSSRNLEELPRIGEAVHASGARQWFLFEVQPSGRAARLFPKLRVPEGSDVRGRLARLRDRWSDMAICYWGDAPDDGIAVYAEPEGRLAIHDYRADSMKEVAAGGADPGSVRAAWDAVPNELKRRTLANFTAAERSL